MPVWGIPELPAISIFPQQESASYKASVITHVMPVSIDYLLSYNIDTENPSIISEQALGDIIHCILGPTFAIRFTNGISAIVPGNFIQGAISGVTAIVMSVHIYSGSWALGNASGILQVRDVRGGIFSLENILVNGIVKAKYLNSQLQDHYTGLVDNILYVSGGVINYPDEGEMVISTNIVFNYIYSTLNDNPYLQPY